MPLKLRTKRLVQRRFNAKQNRFNNQYGVLGDGSGNLYVSGKENYVYARVNGRTIEVFNVRVTPSYGLPVSIGYDPTDPYRQQVLSMRSRQAESSGVDTPGNGFPPASRYGWLGADPMMVDLRQVLPLRINSNGDLSISVTPGPVKLGSVRTVIEYQTLNLASMQPGTIGKAKLVLATLDTSGDLVATGGSEVDITALLDFSTAPDTPIGTAFELALIRLYYGQVVIREANMIDPDIFDIRGTVMSTVYSGSEGLNSPLAWEALTEISSLADDDLLLVMDDSEEEIKKLRKVNLPSGTGGSSSLAIIEHQESSGTAGGDFLSGSWRDRPLNTIKSDPDSIVDDLTTNQFRLLAGKYRIKAKAQTYRVNVHQLRLYDVTNSAVIDNGLNSVALYSNGAGTTAYLSVEIVLTSTTTFKIQHYCTANNTGNGMGVPLGIGTEVYAQVEIEKIN